MAGLIAICLCLTVTVLELMKLKREARMEAAAKEEAAKAGPIHSFPNQVGAIPAPCVRQRAAAPAILCFSPCRRELVLRAW